MSTGGDAYVCLKCGKTSQTLSIDGGSYFCSRECQESYLLSLNDAPEKPKNLEAAIFGAVVVHYVGTHENPERWRGEIYAGTVVEGIDEKVVALARGAAVRCESTPIVLTALQEVVWRAARDFYLKLSKTHADRRADAFAWIIAAAVDVRLEQRAMDNAKRGFIPRPSVEEEAVEREQEIERNRRRPRKPPLYPV